MERLRPTGKHSIIWCKKVVDYLSDVRQSREFAAGEFARPDKAEN